MNRPQLSCFCPHSFRSFLGSLLRKSSCSAFPVSEQVFVDKKASFPLLWPRMATFLFRVSVPTSRKPHSTLISLLFWGEGSFLLDASLAIYSLAMHMTLTRLYD